MKELNVRDFEEFQNKARKFVDGFSRFCNNRRVFRSEAGGLGWGPDPMRGGDVVCVLNGMDMPLVLRKPLKLLAMYMCMVLWMASYGCRQGGGDTTRMRASGIIVRLVTSTEITRN
jgi:hypothetical protein